MLVGVIAVAHAADCVPVALQATAEAVVDAVVVDELERAEAEAWAALESLACADAVPAPEDLATLSQALGAIAIFKEAPATAAPHLAQAAAVHPGWFQDRLGDQVRTAWQEAALGIEGEAQLSAEPLPDHHALWVDGVARAEQPVVTLPGQHLVQITDLDGVVAYGRQVELVSGQALTLATGLVHPSADVEPERRRWSPFLVGAVAAGALSIGGWSGGYAVTAPYEAALESGDTSDLPAGTTADSLRAASNAAKVLTWGFGAGGAAVAAIGGTLHVVVW